MTRVKTYDYWAYAYHVLYYSKSVGTTWGKNLDHYYYGNLASGTPETADFEIVAEDGMGNTYRTSKLQTDFIGFCPSRFLKAMPRPEKGAAFFLPVHRRGCRHVASRAQVPPPALREPRRRPYTAAFRPGRSIPAFGLREVVISAHSRLRDGP